MTFEVVIERFETAAQASLVLGRLAAEGIEAFLVDEYFIGIEWWLSYGVGGVKLVVARDDAATAAEVLSAFEEGAVAYEPAEGQPPFGEQRTCPHCGTESLIPYDLKRHLVAQTMFLFAGLVGLVFIALALRFVHGRAEWFCLTCGRRSEAPAEVAEQN